MVHQGLLAPQSLYIDRIKLPFTFLSPVMVLAMNHEIKIAEVVYFLEIYPLFPMFPSNVSIDESKVEAGSPLNQVV